MTTTHDSAVAEAPREARGMMIPRLGSLLAFAPLAVWTTWHLWQNLSAWQGRDAWEAHVTAPRPPVVELITSLIVLLPLVLHTVWGVRRLFIMKPNLGRYRTFGNLKYILQRLTAVGLLAFIPAHIWLARIYPLVRSHGTQHESFVDISTQMHNHLPTLVVYVLGVLGTCYHLANGLATGGMTWGYAASPRAMRRMNSISIGTFVVLLAMGWGAVFALWNAGATAQSERQGVPPPSAAAPVAAE